MDSTLFNEEGIDLIAQAAGPVTAARVAAITASAMAGELDFAQSLQHRVAALGGLELAVVHQLARQVSPTKGASEMISAVHAAGGVVCAVSGGFHELIDPLAGELGVDDWRANRFEVADGILTGQLEGPLIDAQAKRELAEGWAVQFGVDRERCIAVGDGANDMEMLRWAGTAVGFAPKPIVEEVADVVIRTRDLGLVVPHLGLDGA